VCPGVVRREHVVAEIAARAPQHGVRVVAVVVSYSIAVLRPGGHCYLACFSDLQPGTCGPRRVSQDELRAAFSHGWAVTSIEAAAFELSRPGIGIPFAQAWLAVLERTGQG
jgi:hypothetical protein